MVGLNILLQAVQVYPYTEHTLFTAVFADRTSKIVKKKKKWEIGSKDWIFAHFLTPSLDTHY